MFVPQINVKNINYILRDNSQVQSSDDELDDDFQVKEKEHKLTRGL